MKEKYIGKVIHFFPKVQVVAIELEGKLKVGDKVKFKKGEKEHEEIITSMQIEHKDVKEAGKGEKVGVKVSEKIKEGFEVYKIIE